MSTAPACQRSWPPAGQKPALVKTSLRAVIALWAAGCGTTPLEAVVPFEGAASGSAGSSATAPPECDIPANTAAYVLSAETGCLSLGEPTTVFGDPAYTVQLSADCGSAEGALWELRADVGADTVAVLNLDTGLALDVRAASDMPGTPIILYEPTTLDNQRFSFVERSFRRYALVPRHAPSLCAEARGSGVEIWPCEPENRAQWFQHALIGCQ